MLWQEGTSWLDIYSRRAGEVQESTAGKEQKEAQKESKGSDDESVGSTRSKKSSRSAASKKASLGEAAKAFATAMAENMDTLNKDDDSYSYTSRLSHRSELRRMRNGGPNGGPNALDRGLDLVTPTRLQEWRAEQATITKKQPR
jgi:hypothetical protein